MQNSSLQTTTNELTDNIGIPVKGNFHVEDYIPAGIDSATSDCSQYVRAALLDCKNAGGGTVNIGTLAILLSDVCVCRMACICAAKACICAAKACICAAKA